MKTFRQYLFPICFFSFLMYSCLLNREVDVPVSAVCACLPPVIKTTKDVDNTELAETIKERKRQFTLCLAKVDAEKKLYFDYKEKPKDKRSLKIKEYYDRLKSTCPEAIDLLK